MGFDLAWLSWLVVGLVAGAVAKLVVPGRRGGGFWFTMLVGVAGAILGGVVAGLVFKVEHAGFTSLWTWLFSIAGSVVLLLVWGAITTRRGSRAVEK